jgi:radical SAM protein with 4Fe4S-binding SPASM domain
MEISYKLKKLSYFLLGSPLISINPLYRYFYQKKVRDKIPYLEKIPSYVIVENSNICNLSCIFCPNESMKRKRGIISDSLFRKIVDQCAQIGVPNILIQGFGEPLLDKDYLSKVEYAKKSGIKNVHCVTNGTLLTKDISRGLINAGLDYIYISIDAASPQVYGQIHKIPGSSQPSDKFHDVVENIDNLIALKKELKSAKPGVEVRFKDFDVNKSDLRRFIKKYRNNVEKVNIFMNIFNWPGSNINNNLPKSFRLVKFPCYNLWSSLYITFDGRVALCCQDYECRTELGDVNKESIMDIWHGERLADIRRQHLAGKFNINPVCRDCVINTQLLSPWWG